MKKTKWLRPETVQTIHDLQLLAHGGKEGTRDDGLLASALARPENKELYASPTLFDMAAAYAYGIISNHPFIDGNKRTGFLAAYTFLRLNGYHLQASEVDAYMATIALAQKEISEQAFAAWLRKNSHKEHKKTP